MSQITLRQLPENLEKQIRSLSKKNNTSINKIIIQLLKKSLGHDADAEKKRSLRDLSGRWNPKELEEFERNTREFEKIDREIWK
jgi:hypothetical protein